MMEFVSWDDDIPNMMGKIKNVSNHQPEKVGILEHLPFDMGRSKDTTCRDFIWLSKKKKKGNQAPCQVSGVYSASIYLT